MDWGKVIYVFFALMSLTSIVGFLYERSGTRNIYYYGGLKDLMPSFCTFFFLACCRFTPDSSIYLS